MNLMNVSFFSIIPVILFTIFLLKWLYYPSTQPKKLPPSPPWRPIIGNLHQLGSFPHRSLQKLSAKYGPVMLIHLGSKPALVISSDDAACEIMKTHDLIFSNRPKLNIADKLLYGSKDVAFSPYGEYWRQVRHISVFQLLSHKRVKSFRDVREEETLLVIEKINKECSSSSSLSSLVNLSKIFIDLTNDIICKVALGRKYGDDEKGRKTKEILAEFHELLRGLTIGDHIPWLQWVNRLSGLDARVKKISKEIDEFLEKVIEEHENKEKVSIHDNDDDKKVDSRSLDFVDILLEVKRENLTGFYVAKDTLKALILDMFVAGTDTTHTVMVWAMAEVLRHPKVLEKLQIEIKQEGKTEISEDDLDKMQFLKAVIKETLRLHAPVPLLVPRESTQDIKVMGYEISAGTEVFVNAWAIGRNPLLWEKPEEFLPERFLNRDVDFRGLNNFELIPFGAGRRGCPGITFAMAVIELSMAKLLHKFNFHLPEEDIDMTESNGITVNKKFPLLAVATQCSF